MSAHNESREVLTAIGVLCLVFAGAAMLAGVLSRVPAGCTVAGATCSDALSGCPTLWTCERGRCVAPRDGGR